MGAKQTKMDSPQRDMSADVSLNLTPSNANAIIVSLEDPRSPNLCRTPLSTLAAAPPAAQQQQQQQKGWGLLRRHLLKKTFGIDLNDPRSPSADINRTPLMLPDSPRNKSFDLNDTFADLLIETRAQQPAVETVFCDVQQQLQTNAMDLDVDADDSTTHNTALRQSSSSSDSVSVSAKSTIWSDLGSPLTTDDAATSPNSNVFYWSFVQAKMDEIPMYPGFMSQKMTDTSLVSSNSINAYCTPIRGNSKCNNNNLANKLPKMANRWAQKLSTTTTTNYKHLEQAYAGKVRLQQKPKKHTQFVAAADDCVEIYEDSENENIDTTLPKTPRKRPIRKCNYKSKRTPLSCARNRTNKTQDRARSVSPLVKSPKTRLSLTSFDDSLNALQSPKVSDAELQ